MEIQFKNNLLTIDAPGYVFEYDLESALFSLKNHEHFLVKNAFSHAIVNDFKVKVTDSTDHVFNKSLSGVIEDQFGRGIKAVIDHPIKQDFILRQGFYFYEQKNHLILDLTIVGNEPVSSNMISPISLDSAIMGEFSLSNEQELRMLYVPFDNDRWTRFGSFPLHAAKQSYELTAIYEEGSKNGIVLGSISHDMWKTGIRADGTLSKLESLVVYGGAANDQTRDSLPHGKVTGKSISSPKIFIGYEDDYKKGLRHFAETNMKQCPPLKWDGDAPVGWNSWAAAGTELTVDLYKDASDFTKELKNHYGFGSSSQTFMNLDAFWGTWDEKELVDSVKHVQGNGQKPGIYWTPFTFWSFKNKETDFVEGTGEKYRYKDILLRDFNGELLPVLDGGYSLDPTHPGTLERIEWMMKKILKWKFEYIKLDFLGHGAREGVFYDTSITTGIQAYNLGMRHLNRCLMAHKVFINISISPIFPYHYAHSRRISCDVFGLNKDTEYLLNSITYGWWMNKTIYEFNDPDHIVLYKSFQQEPSSLTEGRSRLNAGIAGGSQFILGDNFSSSESRERAARLLQNPRIMDVFQKQLTFVPLEQPLGENSSHIFIAGNGAEEETKYLVIFNTSETDTIIKKVKTDGLNLLEDRLYHVEDIWRKEHFQLKGSTLSVRLDPMESTILIIT